MLWLTQFRVRLRDWHRLITTAHFNHKNLHEADDGSFLIHWKRGPSLHVIPRKTFALKKSQKMHNKGSKNLIRMFANLPNHTKVISSLHDGVHAFNFTLTEKASKWPRKMPWWRPRRPAPCCWPDPGGICASSTVIKPNITASYTASGGPFGPCSSKEKASRPFASALTTATPLSRGNGKRPLYFTSHIKGFSSGIGCSCQLKDD